MEVKHTKRVLSSRSSGDTVVSIFLHPPSPPKWAGLICLPGHSAHLLLLTWNVTSCHIKCCCLTAAVHTSAPCAGPVVLGFNMWTLTLVLRSDFFPMMLLGLLNKKALLTPPLCFLSSTRCVVSQHYPIAVCFSRVSWSSVGNVENRVVIFKFWYVS